jgi:hypothetical protein
MSSGGGHPLVVPVPTHNIPDSDAETPQEPTPEARRLHAMSMIRIIESGLKIQH